MTKLGWIVLGAAALALGLLTVKVCVDEQDRELVTRSANARREAIEREKFEKEMEIYRKNSIKAQRLADQIRIYLESDEYDTSQGINVDLELDADGLLVSINVSENKKNTDS